MLDLEEKRVIDYDQGRSFAESRGMLGFMETSAKTAENVAEVFTEIARDLYKYRRRTEVEQFSITSSSSIYAKKKKGCC